MEMEEIPHDGSPQDELPLNGLSQDRIPQDDSSQDGFDQDGIPQDDFSQDGIPQDDFSQDGISQDGLAQDGIPQDDSSQDGISQGGISQDGLAQDGIPQDEPNPEWVSHLTSAFWSENSSSPKTFTDLTFFCTDGCVSAHKNILRTFSIFLNKIVIDGLTNGNIEIIVPDFSSETVLAFLELLYTGASSKMNETQIEDLKDFSLSLLGVWMEIEKIPMVEENNVTIAENPTVDDFKSQIQDDSQMEVINEGSSEAAQLILPNKTVISPRAKSPVHESVDYRCRPCCMVFSFRQQLTDHNRATHTRPYQCQICQKCFTQKGHLKEHVFLVHEKLVRYKCDCCHKEFGHKGSFKKHCSTHGDKTSPEEQKFVFNCLSCNRKFRTYILLDAHEKMCRDRSSRTLRIFNSVLDPI